jgi:RNA polymerase sigma-70 factor (ECF subfamily)
MSGDDRQAFAAALRAGAPDAVDRLYRDHARAVLAWCLRLGPPEMDVEDAAQEVFITALRRLGEYRGDASVSTWLFQVTRRVVANQRRRHALRRFFGLESAPEPSVSAAAEAALGREGERRLVRRALARLSEAHREVIVLVDLDERPAPEAAEMLGVPIGTIYSRLHAARRAFATAAVAEGWEVVERDGAPVLAVGR